MATKEVWLMRAGIDPPPTGGDDGTQADGDAMARADAHNILAQPDGGGGTSSLSVSAERYFIAGFAPPLGPVGMPCSTASTVWAELWRFTGLWCRSAQRVCGKARPACILTPDAFHAL